MSNEPNVIVSNAPWNKPLPNVDEDNVAFWEGLKKHKFLVWKCKTCGASYWPKAYCQNHENHMALDAGFVEDGQFVYALIELDEGPLVSSTLVGPRQPKDTYDIGQKVEVVYEDHPAEGFTVPRFRIVD